MCRGTSGGRSPHQGPLCSAVFPRSSRVRREQSLSGLRSSHSQTVITRQPSLLSALVVLRSRSTFWLNFFNQNSRLLLGVYAYLQSKCRCQKHP
jgi:hypothetical protein